MDYVKLSTAQGFETTATKEHLHPSRVIRISSVRCLRLYSCLDRMFRLSATYSNERLKILCQTSVSANYKGQEEELPLTVAAEDGPSLFGRNWLQAIQLDWASLKVN